MSIQLDAGKHGEKGYGQHVNGMPSPVASANIIERTGGHGRMPGWHIMPLSVRPLPEPVTPDSYRIQEILEALSRSGRRGTDIKELHHAIRVALKHRKGNLDNRVGEAKVVVDIDNQRRFL